MRRGCLSWLSGARVGRAWPRRGLAGLIFLLLAGSGGGRPDPDAPRQAPDTEGRYIGSQVCAECHPDQYRQWRGSHHERAMQPATPATVLGDFRDRSFVYGGVRSRFRQGGDRFYVRTDGPDGRLAEYEILYTFGLTPLQQYLVALPGGRLQALPMAWDTRPKSAGGQRWFHLYAGERVGAGHPLHWTRLNQNWNWMCAECHSTNLRRNYDPVRDRFATTWSEINVACEACHGPGSAHRDWAGKAPGWERIPHQGLTVRLDERRGVAWRMNPDTGTARRDPPAGSRREVETCALCHARRAPLADGLGDAGRLMDSHEPALLTRGLYFPDGQQEDEVYNYASFLQSVMHAQGVTCGDCHDPHSGKPRLPGNALCAQCHLPARFDTPGHTLHKPGSPGAACAACHMPTRTYMGVDPRHDHAFRVPRPDLGPALGTPNACGGCHADKDARWAADRLARAFGPPRKGHPRIATALAAGRVGVPGAQDRLLALAADATAPAIVRATALTELRPGDPSALPVIDAALRDSEALLRGAAADALLGYPPGPRLAHLEPLLGDPVLAVRLKAARALASASLEGMAAERRARFLAAFDAYEAAQVANANRPEARLNLGRFHFERGARERAAEEYRAAIRLQPDFMPAYLNLADLERAGGRESDAEAVLREGLRRLPGNADLSHALGLLRIRQGRRDEALPLLRLAAESAAGSARHAYVYAVALRDLAQPAASRRALEGALKRFPNDPELLHAAAAYALEAGDRGAALRHGRRFAAVVPRDVRATALLEALLVP